ncbi:MAG TPA: hypothetical protein VNT79_00645 [Phycisphaerae bacterium]|nr:hypothetical protein [Phycisphaerae bacterium]
MPRKTRLLLRAAKVIPVAMLYQQIGCLPNDAFAQVFAENVIFTSGIVIQTITSILFSTFFSGI